MNLLQKQQEYFQKIMDSPNLTSEFDFQTNQSNLNDSWKVLIFDDFTYNIISNFKIGDLRENNITLHLHIKEKKEELLGVQVIYFISPNEKSINYFFEDLKKGYFDDITLNFSSLILKKDFEIFCQKCIDYKKTSCLKKIFQFNLDFYPMGDSLFTFNIDKNILDFKEKDFLLAKKILNFFFFTGILPIIVFEKKNERSERIVKLVKEMFDNETDFFTDSKNKLENKKKVILFLKENEDDLSSFLTHSFEYFPLIVEHFNVCKNKNSFNSFEIEKNKIQLDFKNDKFFEKNSFEDFPNVAENVWTELESLKKRQEKYTMNNKNSEIDNYADNFFEAIENLPEITEKKKIYSNHSKMCSKLMKIIEKNELEKFCVLSTDIIRTKKLSSDNFLEILSLFGNKNLFKNDKLRLIYIILKETEIQKPEFQKLEKSILENTEFSEKEKKFLSDLKNEKYKNENTSNNFFSNLKNQSSTFLKNIISNIYLFKASKLLNEFFKTKNVNEKFSIFSFEKDFQNFDFNSCKDIIFISIDGGSLVEFSEIKKLGKDLNKNIIYGMDSLKDSEDILKDFISN